MKSNPGKMEKIMGSQKSLMIISGLLFIPLAGLLITKGVSSGPTVVGEEQVAEDNKVADEPEFEILEDEVFQVADHKETKAEEFKAATPVQEPMPVEEDEDFALYEISRPREEITSIPNNEVVAEVEIDPLPLTDPEYSVQADLQDTTEVTEEETEMVARVLTASEKKEIKKTYHRALKKLSRMSSLRGNQNDK